jgi:hypothetical protein
VTCSRGQTARGERRFPNVSTAQRSLGGWIKEMDMDMDDDLKRLLEQAKSVVLSEDQLEAHRIAIAAANGNLSDDRISIETMTATRVIMRATEPGAPAPRMEEHSAP